MLNLKKLIKENPVFKEKQQLDYNCGPTAMTYCLSVLGFESDQVSLCTMVDTFLMSKIGTLPTWFSKIAVANEIDHDDIVAYEAGVFIDILYAYIKKGPAILLVNGGHWVAVLDFCDKTGKFIINDPANESKVLARWSPRKLLKEAKSYVDILEVTGYYAFHMKRE